MARRTLLSLVALFVLAAGARIATSATSGGSAEGGGAATVLRTIDGDTIQVRTADGAVERVRYIAMDTPESVKPGTPVQCYAEAASDRYGRLLAYVYREPDGLFVNAELVRRGYAVPLTIPPNVRFAGRIAALAREARRAGRGLWSAC
jgi:micrococcal nuclease